MVQNLTRPKFREQDCAVFLVTVSALVVMFVVARAADHSRRINLPTSKTLTLPVPGYLARTNSFPATIALSQMAVTRRCSIRDTALRRLVRASPSAFSISATINCAIVPDDRLSDDYSTRQSYFIGLAFLPTGSISMLQWLDHRPDRREAKNTGNGIAVYKFAVGQVTPERFVKIAPQPIAEGKEVAFGVRKTPARTALPYPAGLAVCPAPRATACSSPNIFPTT